MSFTDIRGVRHTVDVTAESLYEAVVLAVRVFRTSEWIEQIGPAAPIDVEVRAPSAKHTLTLTQVDCWLDGSTISPNEKVKKARLKQLLSSS